MSKQILKMERGGSSNQPIKYKYSRRPKSAGISIPEPPNAVATRAATNIPDLNPPPGFKRDPDQYMPIANVVRIMRRILPPHAKIADDAKETIQECVSEFISFITGEANDKCHREYRKTVTAEDVLSAMGSLGFDNYVETLTLYLNKYRANDPDRGPIQQLPIVRRPPPNVVQRPRPPPVTVSYVPLPPAADADNYSEFPAITDFCMGNHGGGEGTSREMEEFDPFK